MKYWWNISKLKWIIGPITDIIILHLVYTWWLSDFVSNNVRKTVHGNVQTFINHCENIDKLLVQKICEHAENCKLIFMYLLGINISNGWNIVSIKRWNIFSMQIVYLFSKITKRVYFNNFGIFCIHIRINYELKIIGFFGLDFGLD